MSLIFVSAIIFPEEFFMDDVMVHANDGSRDKKVIRTSVIGILANLMLAGFKAVVGLFSSSISIILDAVNNLSDAASSLITIVGTKLAAKEPDKKHPFGYGRVEYLSAMVIAVIVLYAGVTSLVESIKKIIRPVTPQYKLTGLIIIGVAVLVKIILGNYVKSMGKKLNSDSLVNSGTDAILDSVISFSTLIAAIIYIYFHLSLEAYLGAVISLLIIKAGFEMLLETLSKVLGERAEASLVREIKKTVASFDQVHGAYDLVLNNYGPDAFNGSIHIEVDDTLSAGQLDELTRAITEKVYVNHHVLLMAVGVYSTNTKDGEISRIKDAVQKETLSHKYVIQMHGFYVNPKAKSMRFDIVVSFDAPSRLAVCNEVRDAVMRLYPEYRVVVAADVDYSEL